MKLKSNSIKYLRYDDNDFAYVRALRKAVFIDEQGAISNEEFDEYDRNALFILILNANRHIATARIADTSKGVKIGRIAVDKNERGSGYGSLIVNTAVEKAIELGADEVYVDAQNYAIPFYEKLGFRVIGSEIIDRGLVHTPMKILKGEFNERKKK